jgi:hypothetical protein
MAADFRSEVVHWTGAMLLARAMSFAWVPHLFGLLPAMFGYPLAALIGCGMVAAVCDAVARRDHLDLLVFAWLLPVWAVVGIDGRDYSRYYVIVAPVLALLSARGLVFVWRRSDQSALLRGWTKPAVIGIGAVSLAYAVFLSTAWSNLFATLNVRTEAGMWIAQHVAPGSSMAMTKPSWQYEMPPIDRDRFTISVTGEQVGQLAASRAGYFVASSAQYGPVMRDREGPAYEFWRAVLEGRTRYRPEKRWERRVRLGGIVLPAGWVPEDMTYVAPTILLYRREGE